MESERREWAAERAELEECRKGDAETAAREAADAMVRQRQLFRTSLDIERRLEEAKVDLRVELGEIGLRLGHDAFWAKVNGLPPAAPEDFFLRVDAEHGMQRQQQQKQQQQRQQQQKREAFPETSIQTPAACVIGRAATAVWA